MQYTYVNEDNIHTQNHVNSVRNQGPLTKCPFSVAVSFVESGYALTLTHEEDAQLGHGTVGNSSNPWKVGLDSCQGYRMKSCLKVKTTCSKKETRLEK